MAKKIGVGVKDIYWTLGSHDVVAICEAGKPSLIVFCSLHASGAL